MFSTEFKLLNEYPIVTKPLDPTAQRIGDPDALLVGKEPARRAPLRTMIASRRQARLNPSIDMKALHGPLPRPVSHRHVHAITMGRDGVRLI